MKIRGQLNKSNNSNRGGYREGAGRPGQHIVAGPHLKHCKLGWWAAILTDDERALYRYLRRVALEDEDGGRGGVRRLLDALGGGHAEKLAPLLLNLEHHRFIRNHQWGRLIPAEVTVHNVPAPPATKRGRARLEEAADTAALQRHGPPSPVVWKFTDWYVGEWRARNDGQSHPPVTGREFGQVKHLLRQYPAGRLQKMAIHWFRMMEDGSHRLGGFAARIGEVAASYAEARREYQEGRRWEEEVPD